MDKKKKQKRKEITGGEKTHHTNWNIIVANLSVYFHTDVLDMKMWDSAFINLSICVPKYLCTCVTSDGVCAGINLKRSPCRFVCACVYCICISTHLPGNIPDAVQMVHFNSAAAHLREEKCELAWSATCGLELRQPVYGKTGPVVRPDWAPVSRDALN